MSYTDIKREIIAEKGNLDNSRELIRHLTIELNSANEELQKIDVNQTDRYEEQEKKAKLAFEQEIARPFEEKIKDLENLKVKAKLKLDGILENITETKYKEKFAPSINIDDEIERCKNIKETTSKFYGEDFQDVVEKIAVDDNYKIDDIEKIIPNLRKMSDVMEKTGDIDSILYKIQSVASVYDTEENKNKILFISVFSIIILIASIVAYPLILLGIGVGFMYNIIKSYTFLKCTSARKSMELNIDDINDMLNNKISKYVESDREKYNRSYEKAIQRINHDIDKISDDCSYEVERQGVNFIFDKTKIDEDFKVLRTNAKDKIDKLQNDINEEKTRFNGYASKIQNLVVQLDKCLEEITKEYVPDKLELGKNMPSDYLLDIVDKKPITWSFQPTSCLFLYNSIKDLNNFLEILFYQTILRVDPKLIKFHVYDEVYLGEVFKAFETDDIVTICDSSKDINESISSYNEEMKRRLSIMKDYDSIESYNEFMLGMECEPESIDFAINCNADVSNLVTQENMQILLNGKKCGMYEYIFLDEKKFMEGNKDADLSLIEYVDKIFTIMPNKVMKKAKMFYQMKLEEK